MAGIRSNPPKDIAGLKVKAINDYLSRERTDLETGEKTDITLPVSNVLLFELEGGAWLAARPSGTEPKIKFYIGTNEKTIDAAEKKIDEVIDFVNREFVK